MRRAVLLLVVVALAILLTSGVAGAITYGQPDDPENPEYPYVGALVVSDDLADGQKFVWCSGTLISPTVFLTAAHCVVDHEQYAVSFEGVTFDPTFDPENSKVYSGTLSAHEDFERISNYFHDIGVVVLDSQVEDVDEYGDLPRAGLLDELYREGALRGKEFTSVGYGDQERTHEPGSGSPAYGEDEVRMFSTQLFRTLTKNHLKLSQNPALGYGGTCWGDSGGPVFLGGSSSNQLVALTSTGDAVCTATSVNYRLDTPEAREFLADFVKLP
jgi:secreted trypsin-like serine protease